MKLLINADDLGYTPVINNAIFDLHCRNRLFSMGFRRLIARPNITLEMVIYPEKLHDPEFPPDTLQTHQRQWEYDFLLNARFDEWLELKQAEISSYKAL